MRGRQLVSCNLYTSVSYIARSAMSASSDLMIAHQMDRTRAWTARHRSHGGPSDGQHARLDSSSEPSHYGPHQWRQRGSGQFLPTQHRGNAPERAGEALIFVGSGSLGRVDLVETALSPSGSLRETSCFFRSHFCPCTVVAYCSFVSVTGPASISGHPSLFRQSLLASSRHDFNAVTQTSYDYGLPPSDGPT